MGPTSLRTMVVTSKDVLVALLKINVHIDRYAHLQEFRLQNTNRPEIHVADIKIRAQRIYHSFRV